MFRVIELCCVTYGLVHVSNTTYINLHILHGQHWRSHFLILALNIFNDVIFLLLLVIFPISLGLDVSKILSLK